MRLLKDALETAVAAVIFGATIGLGASSAVWVFRVLT
jgi:hypothetical protein